MSNELSNYGKDFQYKVISSILLDSRFLNKIIDIIDSDFFDGEGSQWIIDKIRLYYKKYKSKPTLDFLKTEFKKEDGSLKTSIKNSLISIQQFLSSEDLEWVKDEILEFSKNKALEKALSQSVDFLASKRYLDIRKVMDKALNAGQDSDIDYDYVDSVEKRYSEESLRVIPTRWENLNVNIKGGLPIGKLGMIIGGTGGGKSWLLCDIGEYAVEQGYNVNHYTLELDSNDVARRYDTFLTNQSDDENLKDVGKLKDAMSSIKGNLSIKFYPASTASIFAIRSHIEKCILINKKPDLCIIDYPELIKMDSTRENRQNIDDVYKEIRSMASEYDMAIWVVSQSNREGYKSNIIKGEHIAEHFGKISHCDLVLSWSRPDDSSSAYLHYIKSRLGPDKFTQNAFMDTYKGIISISNEDFSEIKTQIKLPESFKTMKYENKY